MARLGKRNALDSRASNGSFPQGMTNNARLISSKELGGIIGINTRTIQHYAKQGLIPCYRINTSYRFALGEVVAAMRVTKQTEPREKP